MTMNSAYQQTVKRPVSCASVGLHTGKQVTLNILPAEPNMGILFKRRDIDGGNSQKSVVQARYDLVTDTMLGTTIENEHGVGVATVEHLMAALWGMGVDNAVITLDGPEVPIMDGSSADFIALIERAGLEQQPVARSLIVIDEEIAVSEGDSTARLEPHAGLALEIEIAFKHEAIQCQKAQYDFAKRGFREALSEARTFGFASDVEKLQAAGLARGGSLENAIVIDDDGVMNEGGLRFDDEFVRHKALDCVGDYFLAGMYIWGKSETYKPGHSINNKLMHALFNTPTAWRLVDATRLVDMPDALAALPSQAQTQTPLVS